MSIQVDGIAGGASAGKFDFPDKALGRPDYASEDGAWLPGRDLGIVLTWL